MGSKKSGPVKHVRPPGTRGEAWAMWAYQDVYDAWRSGMSAARIVKLTGLGQRKVKEAVAKYGAHWGPVAGGGWKNVRKRRIETAAARAMQSVKPPGGKKRMMNVRELNGFMRTHGKWTNTEYSTTYRDVQLTGKAAVVRNARNRAHRAAGNCHGVRALRELLKSWLGRVPAATRRVKVQTERE